MQSHRIGNVSPEVMQRVMHAMGGFNKYLARTTLEKPLQELVKIRASQINRCGYCLDMHTKDARAAGETEQRIYGVPAWREFSIYTPRERAALAWTEAVTEITDGFVPDTVYEEVRPHFSDEEIVDLTMAVIAINSWNRLNVPLRVEAGDYEPGQWG